MLPSCTSSCTCIHTSCYAAVHSHALAHIRHATCTCIHTSCYAAVRSHALAYIRQATLLCVLMYLHAYVMLYVLMHLHTYIILRRCTFACTCTHTSCYAAVRSHALATHPSCYSAVRFHALARIRHATPLYVLMHFQIVGWVLGGWLWIGK